MGLHVQPSVRTHTQTHMQGAYAPSVSRHVLRHVLQHAPARARDSPLAEAPGERYGRSGLLEGSGLQSLWLPSGNPCKLPGYPLDETGEPQGEGGKTARPMQLL